MVKGFASRLVSSSATTAVELQSTEMRGGLRGLTGATLRMLQKYRVVGTGGAVDVTYSFSVPSGGGTSEAHAAVVSVQVVVDDGRVINGKVLPRSEAEAQYASARASGLGAALVAQDRNSTDVFKTTIATVLPGSTVAVCVVIFLPTTFDRNGDVRITLPVSLGSRYWEPGMDARAALRAAPPSFATEWDALGAGAPAVSAAPAGPLTGPLAAVLDRPPVKLQFVVDLGCPLRTVTCPSHDADPAFVIAAEPTVGAGGEALLQRATVLLGDGDTGVPADKDVVIVIGRLMGNQPTVCVEQWQEPQEDAPGAAATTDAFAGIEPLAVKFALRADLAQDGLATRPVALHLVVDCSGSMFTEMTTVRAALKLMFPGLPEGSYVQVTQFGGSFFHWFTEPATTPDNAPKPVYRLLTDGLRADLVPLTNRVTADMGGTELSAVMTSVLGAGSLDKVPAGLPLRVVVLTDGAVTNEAEVLHIVASRVQAQTEYGRDVRVCSIGLGSEVSTALVNGLAASGKGRAVFCNSDNLEESCLRVQEACVGVSLSDVTVTWSPALQARLLPDCARGCAAAPLIFNGEMVVVSALFGPAGAAKDVACDRWVTVRARNEGTGVVHEWRVSLDGGEGGRVGVTTVVGRTLHCSGAVQEPEHCRSRPGGGAGCGV